MHANDIDKTIIDDLQKINKKAYNSFRKIEEKRAKIPKNLDLLDDGSLGPFVLYDKNLTISAANGASKPKLASEFLGLLALNSSPQTLLELRTHMGISSAQLSIVLDNENSKFKITTFDDSPYRQRVAKTIH